MVVSGAIAAALALPGCAPQGYNAADYNGAPVAQQPAANAVEAEPAAEAEDAAPVEDDQKADDQKADDKKADDKVAQEDAAAENQQAPELSEEELTRELTAKSIPRMGKAVVNEDGQVLYRFDRDSPNPAASNCEGECAKIWPPQLTDGKTKLKGIDPKSVGSVKRKDGTQQLTIDGWSVYSYIGDLKPGQWRGQNVGGTWFVISPDGQKNLTCMPEISKPVAAPKDDEDDKADKKKVADTGSDSSGTDYSY